MDALHQVTPDEVTSGGDPAHLVAFVFNCTSDSPLILCSPIFQSWHYRQYLSRLVVGGRVPELDSEYTVVAFYKVYFMSCFGLCRSKITTFVDSHIVFDLSKPLKGPDAEELQELEQLRHGDAAEAEGADAAAQTPAVTSASITFNEMGVSGRVGGQSNQDRADTQAAIDVESLALAVGPLTAVAPPAPTPTAASIPTTQVHIVRYLGGLKDKK